MVIVARMMSFFSHIDQKVTEFQLRTGLRCPSGCGACCRDADVQTTVLEMLPAAHEILRRGESALWLERIDSREPATCCVFYQFNPPAETQGHCEFYAYRPSICRLFGFASVHTRWNRNELSICKYMKQANPDIADSARAHADEALCFSDISSGVYSMDPSLGTVHMSLNIALRRAILRLGLQMQMAQSESLGDTNAA